MDNPPLRPERTDFYAGQRSRSEWEENGAVRQLALQFHHSSNPEFFADPMWSALNRFRTHMVDGDLWEPVPIRSAIGRLMELGRMHQLVPSGHPFDSFIVSKVQFQAGEPSVASMPKGDECPAVAMIEAGPEGRTELYHLDRCFIYAPGRLAAIRWSESWIRAREVQLTAGSTQLKNSQTPEVTIESQTTYAPNTNNVGKDGTLTPFDLSPKYFRSAQWIEKATDELLPADTVTKQRTGDILKLKRMRGSRYLYHVLEVASVNTAVAKMLECKLEAENA